MARRRAVRMILDERPTRSSADLCSHRTAVTFSDWSQVLIDLSCLVPIQLWHRVITRSSGCTVLDEKKLTARGAAHLAAMLVCNRT